MSMQRDILVLTLVIGLFFAFFLGSRPLSVPDEARYCEIPREMVATGDYVTPRLNGVKYFEKPVLFYWLQAASIRAFGLSEWTLRLWPALFALSGCLLAYYAGRKLYGRRAGLFAAAVLATSVLYYALGRTIILDMPVTIFLTGALLSFLLAVEEEGARAQRWYYLAFYAFAALATLTKGRSIGEMAVIDDFPRSATVRARTKGTLVLLTRQGFEVILEQHPGIGVKILKGISRLLSQNLRKTSSRLVDYMLPLS